MKTTKFLAPGLLALLACVLLSSYSLRPGGDTYQVYVDSKLILDQVVHRQKSIPVLTIDSSSDAEVSVNYSHCGVVGTARKLTIRNDQGQTLKDWNFDDKSAPMAFRMKDIGDVKNKNLQLLYTSKEIPEGKLLATLTTTDSKTASR